MIYGEELYTISSKDDLTLTFPSTARYLTRFGIKAPPKTKVYIPLEKDDSIIYGEGSPFIVGGLGVLEYTQKIPLTNGKPIKLNLENIVQKTPVTKKQGENCPGVGEDEEEKSHLNHNITDFINNIKNYTQEVQILIYYAYEE